MPVCVCPVWAVRSTALQPLTLQLPPHVGDVGPLGGSQEAGVVLSPRLSAGMTGSTQTRGRKQVRSIAMCDMIHCDDPQPAAEMRGRKRCSVPGSPGGQADGQPYTHTHPSLLFPAIPAHLKGDVWETLLSCWRENRCLLKGRNPCVGKIQLSSSSSSSRTSLHNCGICFISLCFPFPIREGSGSARPHGCSSEHLALLTSAVVQICRDRSPVSPETNGPLVPTFSPSQRR